MVASSSLCTMAAVMMALKFLEHIRGRFKNECAFKLSEVIELCKVTRSVRFLYHLNIILSLIISILYLFLSILLLILISLTRSQGGGGLKS